MQGQLLSEVLSVKIQTQCAHCDRHLHIQVSGGLDVSVQEAEADVLLFEPDVDWSKLTDPNIIHAY